MSEEQPQADCPHFGYPVETQEHAPDCPNAAPSVDMTEGAMQEGTDIPQESDIAVTESDSEGKTEKQTRALRKLKTVASKLKMWGLAAATVVFVMHTIDKYAKTDYGEPPEPDGSSLTLQRTYKGDSRQPITDLAEAARIRAHYQEKMKEYEQNIQEALEQNAEQIKYLEGIFGEEYVANFLIGIQEKERAQTVPSHMEIGPDTTVASGFENMEVDSDQLIEICKQTYPKGWITSEIDSVVFMEPEPDSVANKPDKYNLGEGWHTVGRARYKELGVTSVDLYRSDSRYMFQVMSHELGHVNDWDHDNSLSAADKIDLFAQVARRFLEGEDLYQSEYVERIDNPDPVMNLDLKISEYWAEICAAYFDYPERLQQNHPEDFALVDGWVHKQDPEYNPFDQSMNRAVYADGLQADYQEKFFSEHYESLPLEIKQDINDMVHRLGYEQARQHILEGHSGMSIDKIGGYLETLYAQHNYEGTWDWLAPHVMQDVLRARDDIFDSQQEQIIAEIESEMSDAAREDFEKLKSDAMVEVESVSRNSLDWLTFETILKRRIDAFKDNHNLTISTDYLLDKMIFST